MAEKVEGVDEADAHKHYLGGLWPLRDPYAVPG